MSRMPKSLGLLEPDTPPKGLSLTPKKSKMNMFGVLAVFVVIACLVVILVVFGSAIAKFLSAMLTR